MLDFEKMEIESVGPIIVLGLMLLVVVGVVQIVLGIMLTIGLKGVFGTIELSDTILFLIFLTQVRHHLHVASTTKKASTASKTTAAAKKK